jgi:hypothetical protein
VKKGSGFMSDVLTRLYQACDPLAPATVEYYVDCSAVRGNNAFTQQFIREISRSAPASYLHYLFSGHIGGGKSSELEHLRHTLETWQPANGERRFFPIFLDTLE